MLESIKEASDAGRRICVTVSSAETQKQNQLQTQTLARSILPSGQELQRSGHVNTNSINLMSGKSTVE